MGYEIIKGNRSTGEIGINFFNPQCPNIGCIEIFCLPSIDGVCGDVGCTDHYCDSSPKPPINSRCSGGGGVKLTCPEYSVNSRP